MAGGGGGFWSESVQYGMKVKDSEWGYTFDDNVILFSWMNYVSRVIPESKVITVTNPIAGKGLTTGDINVGNEILFYDAYMELAGKSKVVSVRNSDYRGQGWSKIAIWPGVNYSALPAVDIVVDVMPKGYNQSTFDTIAVRSNTDGSGFEFDNCTILYSNCRTLGISTSNGIIRNSRIEGGIFGGIVIGPQLSWNVGGFSNNISMINNTFYHSSQQPNHGAAVYILGLGSNQYNISIVNNTFIKCPVPNIMISSAVGATVSGNVFKSPIYDVVDPNSYCGHELICLDHTWARDTIVQNNSVQQENFLSFSKVHVQTAQASKVWIMQDTFELKGKTIYYTPNGSIIDKTNFINAVKMTEGNGFDIKILHGNYTLNESLHAFRIPLVFFLDLINQHLKVSHMGFHIKIWQHSKKHWNPSVN